MHVDEPVGVSILVVVDWSRQPMIGLPTVAYAHVFQSLLWWIGRVNGATPAAAGRMRLVSILVVVDRSRQLRAAIAAPRERRVSILVVVDCRVNVSRPASLTASIDGFQSLLWWIGRVNRAMRIRRD